MCTLIVGREVLAGSVVFGTNRDENPQRPSDPPGVLNLHPRVIGGRDRVAGGTWLAVRPEGAAIAMLNRRPLPGDPPMPTRSRGLLALETARVPASGSLSEAALQSARAQCERDRFAPFSMVFLSHEACWILFS